VQLGVQGGGDAGMIFNLLGGDSALANLSSTLAINGTSQSAAFRFEGKNAGASSWSATVGATALAIASSGSDPLLSEETPLTVGTDKSVRIQGGKIYSTGSTSAYDVATSTDDVILEVVFQHVVTGAEQCICAKYDVATGKGFALVSSATDALISYGAIAFAASGTLIDRAWYHLIVVADRNGNNRCYLNGVLLISTANLNNAQTNTQPFKVGAYGAADASKSSQGVALAQLWICATGTVGTSTDSDVVAATRFHKMCGTDPLLATGSPVPTFTRASIGYLDRATDESAGTRRIFRVGAGWPRVVRRKAGATWYNGYLSEGSATNRLLQSENFASATWTKLNASGAAGTTAPDGSTNGYALTPAVGAATHALLQTVAGSTDYVSIFAKMGTNRYMGIRLNSGGADYAIFDLQNGTVASTSGSSINATIVDYGNGWYLCGCGPGGGTNQIYFVTTNSSSSLSYTEATGASVGTYFFGAMSSSSTMRFSQSYIATAAATASRQSDLLTFVSASNYITQPGAVAVDVILPSSASLSASQVAFQAFTDASNQHIVSVTTAGLAAASVTTAGATEVNGSSTTAVRDATKRKITASFATNNYKLGVDGVAELTDVSCTLNAATTLYVGNSSGALPLFGVITSLKIYDRVKL